MNPELRSKYKYEMVLIVRRTGWIRRSIGLITVSALSICLSIASLFLVVELGLDLPEVVSMLFILSMFTLIAGLLCFLLEILIASKEVVDYRDTSDDTSLHK